MQHLGSNVPHKGGNSECDTQNVDHVVSVMKRFACSTSVLASLLLGLQRARKGLCDKGSFEAIHLDPAWAT